MDGVLTATAKVHAACWKELFDDFLKRRALACVEEFRPFDIDGDYKTHVDGRSRYEGAATFLASRSISLPWGDPQAGAGTETVCGLGNLKDEMVQEVIESDGVEAYEGSVLLVRRLRSEGIKTGVVSSSHHCQAVLEAAGIADLFDVRVDGNDIDRLGLGGKPAPDSFLEAARQLGADPKRAVVVEDAISGVEAGRAGGFSLVIGVDRGGDPESLKGSGAHLVVTDLAEIVC
jgi:alpha,alpha-trehalase